MPRTCTVTLIPLGRKIEVTQGTLLEEVIHDLGVEFPCGGRGLCGNCKVKLLAGEIATTAEHKAVLDRKKLGSAWRLACLSRVEEDITIEVSQLENIVLADNTTFTFTPRCGCGVAVDLGSTTVVSQLLDLQTGAVLGVQSDLNPQTRHGGDIMSRIGFALESREQALSLTAMIRELIGSHVQQLSTLASKPIEQIRIVGNSVMHHLFCDLDTTPLATYPFESPNNAMQYFSAADLDWSGCEQAKITFLPNIGGFVGSDILAGIYASGMIDNPAPRGLIDLGTNGEVAISNGERILCTSTAAGPAFEGSCISCGMRACTGAISSIQENTKNATQTESTKDTAQGITHTESPARSTHVIGEGKASGICGSGLIDALYFGVKDQLIDFEGVIQNPTHTLELIDGIVLQQQDVREFQLAKAAIATGVSLLMSELGITRSEMEKIFIAGGFGNYIQLPHAIGLGMMEFEQQQIHKLSNSALIGAKMFLFVEDELINALLPRMSHFSLEADPAFLEVFCEKIHFPSVE